MEEYLRLMADGRICLDRLQPRTFQLEEAPAAYEILKGEGEKPMLVLLEYPQADPQTRTRTIQVGTCKPHREGQLRTAVIGAGGFAQGMHLPNLLKLNKQFSLNTICSRTGTSSLAAAKQFGIATATTDYAEVLANPDIDLVILCTRHDLHADMVIAALRAGKHVLCEKPLSLTEEGLDAIEAFYADDGGSKPALMVGFNRRWSPAITRLQELLAERTSPIIAHYTMNAGYIPLDHWVHGPEGGGRNVGEGCHLYDLFFALAGAELADVQAASVAPQGRQWARNDNFTATLRFKDGSVFTLLYTAMGDKSYPKERMELFCEGSVYVLDDYKSLKVHGSTSSGWSSMTMAKGQLEELVALHAAIKQGRQVVPVEETLAISRAALEVEQLLLDGASGQCQDESM
jgi:predicted dehydrogenase